MDKETWKKSVAAPKSNCKCRVCRWTRENRALEANYALYEAGVLKTD